MTSDDTDHDQSINQFIRWLIKSISDCDRCFRFSISETPYHPDDDSSSSSSGGGTSALGRCWFRVTCRLRMNRKRCGDGADKLSCAGYARVNSSNNNGLEQRSLKFNSGNRLYYRLQISTKTCLFRKAFSRLQVNTIYLPPTPPKRQTLDRPRLISLTNALSTVESLRCKASPRCFSDDVPLSPPVELSPGQTTRQQTA